MVCIISDYCDERQRAISYCADTLFFLTIFHNTMEGSERQLLTYFSSIFPTWPPFTVGVIKCRYFYSPDNTVVVLSTQNLKENFFAGRVRSDFRNISFYS